jgi:hypothetical protein
MAWGEVRRSPGRAARKRGVVVPGKRAGISTLLSGGGARVATTLAAARNAAIFPAGEFSALQQEPQLVIQRAPVFLFEVESAGDLEGIGGRIGRVAQEREQTVS